MIYHFLGVSKYKKSGIVGFEIFYLKYLTFYIANIMHFFQLIKIRNILKNG